MEVSISYLFKPLLNDEMGLDFEKLHFNFFTDPCFFVAFFCIPL